jgi:hypothetical protein
VPPSVIPMTQPSRRILVIEDEESISEPLRKRLGGRTS